MFEWDSKKAKINLGKHRVSFELASTVFFDEMALDGPDVEHSTNEPRFFRIGRTLDDQILTIAYPVRRSDENFTKIRIISARKASKNERKAYKK